MIKKHGVGLDIPSRYILQAISQPDKIKDAFPARLISLFDICLTPYSLPPPAVLD